MGQLYRPFFASFAGSRVPPGVPFISIVPISWRIANYEPIVGGGTVGELRKAGKEVGRDFAGL
jgi:hypothetical protein